MYRKLIDVRFISFETTLVPFLAIHFVEEFILVSHVPDYYNCFVKGDNNTVMHQTILISS